jgi:hypothetical protein
MQDEEEVISFSSHRWLEKLCLLQSMRANRTFGNCFTALVAVLCFACLPACSMFKSKAPEPEAEKPAAANKPAEPAPVATIVPEPAAQPTKPVIPDDGLRLPDMLTIPQDSELKASASTPSAQASEPAPVVARPPTDAPVKPKAEEPTPD